MKWRLIVDGEERGVLGLELTPFGLSVGYTGDIEFRPMDEDNSQQAQDDHQDWAVPDTTMRRLLNDN